VEPYSQRLSGSAVESLLTGTQPQQLARQPPAVVDTRPQQQGGAGPAGSRLQVQKLKIVKANQRY